MAPIALLIDQPWLEAVSAARSLGGDRRRWRCSAPRFGYVLYFKLIDSAGATNALLVTLLVPPTAILMGGLLLGERLTAGQISPDWRSLPLAWP